MHARKHDQVESKIEKIKSILHSSTLNESQKDAIIDSVSDEKSFALIQGPPGTGKSFTLIEMARVFLKIEENSTNRKLLICTPSNGAVDELVERFLRNFEIFDKGEPNKITFTQGIVL